MFGVILVIHIIVCFGLMAFVLLQAGKGAGLGGAFGGSDTQFFGGRGAATILNKLTIGCAVMFMLTSLSLALLSARKMEAQKSIIQEKAAEEGTIPATQTIPTEGGGIADLGLTPMSGGGDAVAVPGGEQGGEGTPSPDGDAE